MIISELDVVKLKDGREGTVLEVFDHSKTFMIEIANEDGEMLDDPVVKEDEVKEVIWHCPKN